MDIRLKVTDSARDFLAEAGFDSKYGARPLRRAIQTKIGRRSLANEILEGHVKRGDTVRVQMYQKTAAVYSCQEESADYGKN